MKDIKKQQSKIKKAFSLLAALFALTFILRWAYEIFFSYNDVTISYSFGSSYYETDDPYYLSGKLTQNVATQKVNQIDFSGQDIVIDQKYEKTANMQSQTNDFTNDNLRLRQIIGENEALIQSENLNGLDGARKLDMTIGVVPDNFDALVESIRAIGEIKSFSVNKVDKTSEYMNLMAERETLEKTRDSYIAIKEKGGNVQDLLLLEDKILEVERNLQSIGVSIGIYSTEYSFCTVNFSLNEVASKTQIISLRFVFTCAKNSFFWTAGAYMLLIFFAILALCAVVIIIKLYDFIKTLATRDIDTDEDFAGFNGASGNEPKPKPRPRKKPDNKDETAG